jgi:hypothetical protein
MSKRVWATLVLTAALISAAVGYGYSRPGATATFLSRHSMPAAHVPDREVAVTVQGKLFHDPSCGYIHGKPEMISARQAVNRGYTPCPRCLRDLMRTHK